MDYSSWVDTTLDLNSKPLRVARDDDPLLGRFAMAKQRESNFLEMGGKASVKEETGGLVEELNRLSDENKKLTEMLTVMCENYNALRSQLMQYTGKNRKNEVEVCQSRKRKSESSSNNNNNNGNNNIPMTGNSENSSTDEESCKKPREEIIKAKISRVYVRTEASDTSLVVKDGYQWRKYGQKVTRDNPCPRAYFKCSFAPSCPVKKKVQRSVEDQSVLVATYEGEHNHPYPSQMEATSGSSRSLTLAPAPTSASPLACSGSTVTIDLTKSKSTNDVKSSFSRMEAPEIRQFLVEQMASSLTKDPNFTAALAAAISGKVFSHNDNGKL